MGGGREPPFKDDGGASGQPGMGFVRLVRNLTKAARQAWALGRGWARVGGPGPPWRGPWAPRGPPSRRQGPRQPYSLVSGPLALLALAKNMASASSSCFSRSPRILPPSSSQWTLEELGAGLVAGSGRLRMSAPAVLSASQAGFRDTWPNWNY